jgi:hypothetical protein
LPQEARVAVFMKYRNPAPVTFWNCYQAGCLSAAAPFENNTWPITYSIPVAMANIAEPTASN